MKKDGYFKFLLTAAALSCVLAVVAVPTIVFASSVETVETETTEETTESGTSEETTEEVTTEETADTETTDESDDVIGTDDSGDSSGSTVVTECDCTVYVYDTDYTEQLESISQQLAEISAKLEYVEELETGESDTISISEQLVTLNETLDSFYDGLESMLTVFGYILAILVFFVIVLLCKYCYSFLNIFF